VSIESCLRSRHYRCVVRIAFVIPDLGPGGAERVASLLSNDWATRGHVVDLITFEPPETEPFHALDLNVRVHRLQAKGDKPGLLATASVNLTRVSRLRSLLRGLHPDIVVSFMTEANVVALVACTALRLPVIVSERNQPARPQLGWLRRLARRVSYNRAAAIVMQTEELADWARFRFQAPVHVIPNPVVLDKRNLTGGHADTRRDQATFRIVSMGRLTEQKGFDILIESFRRVAAKYPNWKLIIYGDGPRRPALTQLIERGRLGDRVTLHGLTKDVTTALSEATFFVLPSRFEGFPNVLLEALSLGIPAVATDCPGASAEILAHGTYGSLVPSEDIPALTIALETMMTKPELRHAYAARTREAVQRYEASKVSTQWLNLLAPIAAGTRNS
jgi:GalNAc-alpha-(1->4)-GalNAc-alpha-(1->3)-diNAcBac-PP-undecaprenol alpha-1,4-N-acetyl-D-galactosaminyltransferase